MRLAEVAVNVPFEKTFHYILPEGMEPLPYARVEVDFKNRRTEAFVVRVLDESELTEDLSGVQLKTVNRIIDKEPVADRSTVEIAEWMSRYCLSPFGETLFAITPSAYRPARKEEPYYFTGEIAELTAEQDEAYRAIRETLGAHSSYLLHGVTGSGKTEVYKKLAADAIAAGRSVIILIPEISLTPQTLERFRISFGDEVALYHSRLTPGERLSEWNRALKGEAKVMIGPRSAIFAPMRDLGLIIVDEEHEPSYKSQNSPRYHARQVAFFRSKRENATLVLGSATPQVETYYHAKQGFIRLVELKNRYQTPAMPSVEIVDIKAEEKNNRTLTSPLFLELLKTLEKKKQALLFLNRRGFAPSLVCESCGFTFECPNCDVALTLHKSDKHIECHHCGYTTGVPARCPNCESQALKEIGSGTERLETLLAEQFPNANVVRVDADTTRKKGSFHDTWDEVKSGRADIIVGTQMVAKGHDIAGLQLVGAILPDITLSLPDFRSSERAFILLTQVIGRAGRRSEIGRAVIQTYMPENYAITAAAKQDYAAFYEVEIKKREAFGYPPFSRIGRVVFRGRERDKLTEFVRALQPEAGKLQAANREVKILGPVSCPMEKLNNQYRYHIIIKSQNVSAILGVMNAVKDFFRADKNSRNLHIELDLDPTNMI